MDEQNKEYLNLFVQFIWEVSLDEVSRCNKHNKNYGPKKNYLCQSAGSLANCRWQHYSPSV